MPDRLENNPSLLSRRQALTGLLAAGAVGCVSPLCRASAAITPAPPQPPFSPPTIRRFQVAVDDLYLNKRQKLGAFALAQKCGMDGLQVDMGSMATGTTLANELRKPEIRQQFLDESKKTGVQICSLGFFGMYAHVFSDMPIALDITREWIDTMDKMRVKLGFLPLEAPDGLLKNNEKNRLKTIEILKKAAPFAEQAGVIMGIESDFDADGYKRFLDDIGSPAVKVAYNPGRGLEAKYDVYKEIRVLGKDRICMIHLEQGSVAPEKFEHLLGDGPIDLHKLKDSLDAISWSGWLAVARSRKQGREKQVEENYTANAKVLHSIFNQ